MPNSWESIAKRKRDELASRIPEPWSTLPLNLDRNRVNVLNVPKESGLLSDLELRITEQFDATALLAGLTTGIISSVDVVTAFCKRAAIAQQLTNCLTEAFFDEAISRAKELDDHFARTGKPIGPLHGLPISLKDTFKLKGHDASIGVAAFCFNPATENSTLVDLLLSCGAVLYCKTNVPQTMMALDSHNNVFGRTMNPASRNLTAGGSSGGEGALIAMRGSILGIGTDVGGSIRIPALCNGLYGIKPSHGRVPYSGQEGGMTPGNAKVAIESTAGPIATSVRDCELLLRVISDSNPSALDPDVLSQTWSQQGHPNRPMIVGIARTDGHVTPLPPVQRLMQEVAETLRTSPSKIEVVDVDISSFGAPCLKTFNGMMSIDGANTWLDHLEKTGEPLSPWLHSRLRRRPKKSLDEIRSLQTQKLQLQTEFLDVWKESGGYWATPASKAKNGDRTLDVIICPPAPHPVAMIDRWNTSNYTGMFNLLDCPAGVIPVRPFAEDDMKDEIEHRKPLNGWDKINREMWTDVDRTSYLGSALSVQVITSRLLERTLVESMATIDEALLPLRHRDSRPSKL